MGEIMRVLYARERRVNVRVMKYLRKKTKTMEWNKYLHI